MFKFFFFTWGDSTAVQDTVSFDLNIDQTRTINLNIDQTPETDLNIDQARAITLEF